VAEFNLYILLSIGDFDVKRIGAASFLGVLSLTQITLGVWNPHCSLFHEIALEVFADRTLESVVLVPPLLVQVRVFSHFVALVHQPPIQVLLVVFY